MAGYLLTFSDEDAIRHCMEVGVYSTLMSPRWSVASTGTLGDYITMRPGDNIYFFSKRHIYGIGEIVDLGKGKAVVENFDDATKGGAVSPASAKDASQFPELFVDGRVARWLISFKPAPAFFCNGVDMDDMLSSNPTAFRSLRVFWKRSFIKLDDEENLAFKAAILRANLNGPKGQEQVWHPLVRVPGGQEPQVPALLSKNRKRDGSLSNEMLLEVGLLYQLTKGDQQTVKVFGKWDYLSHQVNASPAKPVDYMDKMDVFGYRWIAGFRPIIGRYLMAELKKDKSGGADIPQVMKYVDWVSSEYAHNDYSLVKAFLVARDFDTQSLREHRDEARRDYVIGFRPAEAKRWTDLTLVSYEVRSDGYIRFAKVEWPSDIPDQPA